VQRKRRWSFSLQQLGLFDCYSNLNRQKFTKKQGRHDSSRKFVFLSNCPKMLTQFLFSSKTFCDIYVSESIGGFGILAYFIMNNRMSEAERSKKYSYYKMLSPLKSQSEEILKKNPLGINSVSKPVKYVVPHSLSLTQLRKSKISSSFLPTLQRLRR